jgi:hypothetical protein
MFMILKYFRQNDVMTFKNIFAKKIGVKMAFFTHTKAK